MEDNFIVLNIGHAQTVHKWMNEDITRKYSMPRHFSWAQR